jgi:glycosyltransferase involved in cell wall biosynthesis
MSRAPRLLFAGPMPPPVHGASLITKRYAELLQAGADVRIFDTTARSSGLNYALNWARTHLRVVSQIILAPRGSYDAIYMSLAGGHGLWFQLPVTVAARLKKLRMVVHHHSFQYVNRKARSMRLICLMLREQDRQIFLSQSMASRFLTLYATTACTSIVSNANFIDVTAPAEKVRTECGRRYAHISNLSREKGTTLVLEAFSAHIRRHRMDTLTVVGPCADEHILSRLQSSEFGDQLRYLGALDTDAVYEVLSTSDVLVFPSMYVNEAEPLVVLEALAHGLPVIATGRGCVQDLLPPTWIVREGSVPDVIDAMDYLSTSDELPSLGREARRIFNELKESVHVSDVVLAPSSGRDHRSHGRRFAEN